MTEDVIYITGDEKLVLVDNLIEGKPTNDEFEGISGYHRSLTKVFRAMAWCLKNPNKAININVLTENPYSNIKTSECEHFERNIHKLVKDFGLAGFSISRSKPGYYWNQLEYEIRFDSKVQERYLARMMHTYDF